MSFEDYDIVGMIGREAQGLLLGWRGAPIGARGYYALQNLDLVNGESRDRLLREAALGAQVDHPALVRVHEVVVKDDWALVVTDYVDGHSLAEILDRRAAGRDVFPARVTLELVAHLLDAAQSIHDLQSADGEPCYHGRIGASKILLTADGGLRLVGFGIGSGEVERRSAERLGPAADQFAIEGDG